MRNLIIIILSWIVILPIIVSLTVVGIGLMNSNEIYHCMICLFITGILGAGLLIVTDISWAKYKKSGFKVVITWDNVFSFIFWIATTSAVVAIITGIFRWNTITWVSLCIFAISGCVLFLTLFVEMLLRKD